MTAGVDREPLAPPLCRSLTALLNALVAGARPGLLDLCCRSLHGIGFQQFWLPIPDRGRVDVLPDPVLRFLEDGGWAISVGAATRAPGGDEAYDLAVLFARFLFERTYREGRWGPDPDELAGALDRVAAFPVAPAFVINAALELVAVWALARPMALDRERERAASVQRALAGRLGASTADVTLAIPSQTGAAAAATVLAADDPGGLLPLPGGIVREVAEPAPIVHFLVFAPERTTTIADIETALAGTPAPRRGGKA